MRSTHVRRKLKMPNKITVRNKLWRKTHPSWLWTKHIDHLVATCLDYASSENRNEHTKVDNESVVQEDILQDDISGAQEQKGWHLKSKMSQLSTHFKKASYKKSYPCAVTVRGLITKWVFRIITLNHIAHLLKEEKYKSTDVTSAPYKIVLRAKPTSKGPNLIECAGKTSAGDWQTSRPTRCQQQ